MSIENKQIQMINVDDINILNPRIRNKKVFNDISNNILKVGLKRPITVTKSDSNTHDKEYDLVCGQGRLEAFIAAGQKNIPAIIRDATEEQALIMSLVENLARKQHNPLYLMKGIQVLNSNNYSAKEISDKTGLRLEYVQNIVHLINNGEERLLSAVESGKVPIHKAYPDSNSKISHKERENLYIIQEHLFGKLDSKLKVKLENIGETLVKKPEKRKKAINYNLPSTGAVIVKNWKGKKLEVKILDSGFEYQGEQYNSLSNLAKQIAGYAVSGPIFFGLRQPKLKAS